MNICNVTTTGEESDALLVAATLRGDRDAFGSIVSRYQGLVASLAYSATGNVSQSEDLAQETFVKAWKDLRSLKQPDKLRTWLCTIARHTIVDAVRRNLRQPSHDAAPLNLEAAAADAGASTPAENIISEEEQAIVWRALAGIPETYREPLVLFYREGQSVERVAEQLDLSTDAVKQRLARGRKFLADEVSAFVECTLGRNGPGKGLTLAVLGALPGGSTQAAAVGMATAKTASKAVSLSGIATVIAAFFPIATLGAFLGFRMRRDLALDAAQRLAVVRFWRLLAISILVFVLGPIFLLFLIQVFSVQFLGSSFVDRYRENIFSGITVSFGLLYPAVALGIGVWLWRRRSRPGNSIRSAKEQARLGGIGQHRWVWVGMFGAATILALFILIMVQEQTKTVKKTVTAEEFETAVKERTDPSVFLLQFQDGQRQFCLKYLEQGTRYFLFAPAEASSEELLRERGISYTTSIQGRDFEVFGRAGKLLPFLCVFILSAGLVLLPRISIARRRVSQLPQA